MATQTFAQENIIGPAKLTDLTSTVKRWDRRLRLRQMIFWLPLSLVPGLVIGMVLAILSRMQPLLIPQQIALVTIGLAAAGLLVFTLSVWLWRRSVLTSAQRFDVQFGLNERVSTALELGMGTIRSNDELAARQFEDARAKASAIRVRDHIPLSLRRRDWVMVIVLAVILAILLLLPNPQVDALTAASAQQAAINGAAQQLRQTTQDVSADQSLGNEQRQTLLQQLKTATNTLQQQNVSPQEALAAVSDVQNALKNNANNLNQQASADQAAMQQAANALHQAGTQNSDQQQNSASQQATQNLNQIAQDAQSMNAAQQRQAAQQLQQAAQALQNTNPQAAQQLQQAAQNLQQQSQQNQSSSQSQQQTQQLQQNLQQAAQQLQQQTQQNQQQQQSAQNLNNAANQAQQSANQISQSQQQNQQGQSGSQPQNQQGQQSAQSQQNQQGQSGQNQQQGQQGSQQSQSGQPSQSQQNQAQGAGQSGLQSANAQSQQAQTGQAGLPGKQAQTNAQSEANQQQSTTLSAGDSPGSQQQDDSAGPQQGNLQGNTNNNPDGQGVGQFEAVNVPKRTGNQPNDGNNIQLAPDPSNAPAQQGNFSQNPNGQETVPYNQVYSDYANTANQALDSDHVPLGLRDVVHDYFTSLEPKK